MTVSENCCPFCGSRRTSVNSGRRGTFRKNECITVYWVQCDGCGARGSESGTKQCAINAWEQRRLGWIPAIVQLPEKGQRVLCCRRDNTSPYNIRFDASSIKSGRWCIEDISGELVPVACWMPLPEPSEEDLRWG